MLNFMNAATIYVSQTLGNDNFNGYTPEVDTTCNIGPVKTLDRAFELVTKMRVTGNLCPVSVRIMGDYYLEKPVELGYRAYTKMAGIGAYHPTYGITFESWEGGDGRIIGGRKIQNLTDGTINGHPCVCAYIPEVEEGEWKFTDLCVGGSRARLARYPKTGTLRAVTTEFPNIATHRAKIHDREDGSKWFVAHKEDLEGIEGVENAIVSFYHWWIDEHSPVESYDPETGKITMAYRSRYRITAEYDQDYTGNLEYYLENIPQTMSEPGEWYLDHSKGMLYYIPREGETKDNLEIFAPTTKQLFRIIGTPENPVESINFYNLEMLCSRGDYASWREIGVLHSQSEEGVGEPCGSDIQSVFNAYGAITYQYANHCIIDDCRIHGLGLHAVEILKGCGSLRIENSLLYELGGGAVKIFGGEYGCPREDETHHITIRNNVIHHCGRRYAAACGILLCHANSCEIAENHIYHIDYSGISVGWVWGFKESSTFGNIIRKNHIHHIGVGELSDMGGIYLLGYQPGTVIEDNEVHDVVSNHYGGHGIYLDEGTSYVMVRRNRVYRCKYSAFNQHYGSNNVLQENIFTQRGGRALITNGYRDESHMGMIVEKNVLVTDGCPVYSCTNSGLQSSSNVIWDMSGKEPVLCDHPQNFNLEQWQRIFGKEENSVIRDPGFENPIEGVLEREN